MGQWPHGLMSMKIFVLSEKASTTTQMCAATTRYFLFILNIQRIFFKNRMRLCPLSVSGRTGATPATLNPMTAHARCPSTATGATKLFLKGPFRYNPSTRAAVSLFLN